MLPRAPKPASRLVEQQYWLNNKYQAVSRAERMRAARQFELRITADNWDIPYSWLKTIESSEILFI